jgi:hypothetical protein
MDKIAIFYALDHSENPYWKENFFNHHMDLIRACGLYEKIQFIEIYINCPSNIRNSNYISLSDIPSKTNNLVYLGNLEEEKAHNKKMFRSYNHIQQRIWTFSRVHPEYKILFFYSLGEHYLGRKIGMFPIMNWKQCIELLNYHDCVKIEYENLENGPYQEFFWWANAKHLAKLDPMYFYASTNQQSYKNWIITKGNNFCAFRFNATLSIDNMSNSVDEYIQAIRKSNG